MRINSLLNAIGIMTVIILFMTALFLTAGCSTARTSKKHYIQILYEGEMRPQEDIAVVFTSMKYRYYGMSTTSHLKIIDIDGIKINEIITEVTPGIHKCKIQCKTVTPMGVGEKREKLIETRTPRLHKTFNAKAGYIYYPKGPRKWDRSKKCSTNIVEKHFSELDTSKWKKTLKSYNKSRSEGLYVH
jgi:predicted component of type VI protein secretion system